MARPAGPLRWLPLAAAGLLATAIWIGMGSSSEPPGVAPQAALPAAAPAPRAVAAPPGQPENAQRAGIERLPWAGLTRGPGSPTALAGPAGPTAGSAQPLAAPGGAELYVLGVAMGPDGEALPAGARLELFASFTEQGRSVVKVGRCDVALDGRFEGQVRLDSGAGRERAALEFQLRRPAPSAPWFARVALDEPSAGGRYDVGRLRLVDSPLLVSGRVVDSAGRGVSGVEVIVLAPDAADPDGRDPTPFRGSGDPQRALHLAGPLERFRATVTDGAGRFAIFGEVARADLLVVAGKGPAAVARFGAPGARDLELRLPGDLAVSGRVQLREGAAPVQLLRVALLPAESQAADPLGLRAYADRQPAPLRSPMELPALVDLAPADAGTGCLDDLARAWGGRFDGPLFSVPGEVGRLLLCSSPADPGRRVMQTLGPAQDLRSFPFSLGTHAPGRYRLVWGGLRRVPHGAGLAWRCIEDSIEFDLGAPDSEQTWRRVFELD